MRLRELLNVAILNQTEEKYHQLLVVLFGNPFIEPMESNKKKKYGIFMVSNKNKILVFIQLLPTVLE